MVREFRYPVAGLLEDSGFGTDLVFRLEPAPRRVEDARGAYEEVPHDLWRIEASGNDAMLPHLVDGDPTTFWATDGPQTTGNFLQVEFTRPMEVGRIELALGRFVFGHPLGLRVDGLVRGRWRRVDRGFASGDLALSFVRSPTEPVQKVRLLREKVKALRIIQTGNDPSLRWVVTELAIYRRFDLQASPPDV